MTPSNAFSFDPGSFRDRSGRVFHRGGAILRALDADAWQDWQTLSRTRFFRSFQDDGALIATEAVDGDASMPTPAGGGAWAGVLRHEAIAFLSYPYEWPFAMMKDAALLQLDLLLVALDEGMTLKDGSAYNLQWRGAKAVFIDIASFTRLSEGQVWEVYLQFCRTMLYPLLLQAYKDVPFQPWLRGQLDGIEPKDAAALMSWRDLLRRGVLTHVYLQSKLQARYAAQHGGLRESLRDAGVGAELIRANARRLRRLVDSLTWRGRGSAWSAYGERCHYDEPSLADKKAFVADALGQGRRRLVWDLGCNDGLFSRIAAEHADYVVAIDGDHMTAEHLYRDLKAEGRRDILPLVMNLADVSPGLGWRGAERKGLVERGRPDLIICLALVHHLVIGANIPLDELVDWLAGLGGDLVIEFVTREDAMVERLLANREDIFTDYDLAHFESCLAQRFELCARQALPGGTRMLYFAVPARSTDAPTATNEAEGVIER